MAKWAIFSVALSLLPIAARILGAIIQGRNQFPAFDELFGDGELLVVATVIAAAGIGDVIFDGHFGRNAIGAAGAMASALLVVIFSVLLYGFASLQEKYRNEARTVISEQVVDRNKELRVQAGEVAHRQAELRLRETRLVNEIEGAGGTGERGVGVRAEALRRDLDRARAELDGFSSQLAAINGSILNSGPLVDPSEAVRGRHEAAIASVVMFPLSLAAGALCVFVAAAARSDAESEN